MLPWHWPDASCKKEMVIGYETNRYHWSSRFALAQLGYYMLKLRKREDHSYSDPGMGVPNPQGADHMLVSIELKIEKVREAMVCFLSSCADAVSDYHTDSNL